MTRYLLEAFEEHEWKHQREKSMWGKKIAFVQTTTDEKEIALSPGLSFQNRLQLYKGMHFAPRKFSVADFSVNHRRLKKA